MPQPVIFRLLPTHHRRLEHIMAKQRELELLSVEDVAAEARRLHERGYEQAGSWDLSQVCTHVAKLMVEALDGFTIRANFLQRAVVQLLFKKKMFRTRRIPAGVKAPPGFEPQAGDEAAAVAALEQAIQRLLAHPGPWPDHPFFGNLTREQWLELHAIHGQHHLSFLHPKPASA